MKRIYQDEDCSFSWKSEMEIDEMSKVSAKLIVMAISLTYKFADSLSFDETVGKHFFEHCRNTLIDRINEAVTYEAYLTRNQQ